MTRELSAMSSPALSQLPSELLIQILESLEDFSTVSALGRTSCRLHSIWQANSASICPRILTNVIECPEEANTLFDVQQSLSSPKVRIVGNQAVLDRTKAMISNARMARDILKSFETQQAPRLYLMLGRASLTLTERTDFLRAFYRAFTARIYFYCRPDISLVNVCAEWHVLDFRQLNEVLNWLLFYSEIGATEVTKLDIINKPESYSWRDVWLGFEVLRIGISWHRPNEAFLPIPDLPFGHFLIQDYYERLGNGKGSRLNDFWNVRIVESIRDWFRWPM